MTSATTGLPPLIGHHDVRDVLGGNVARDELPGSVLLHGPAGIGKQRLGLWLGQRLVCEISRDAEPCGTCRSCHLAQRLEHPDVHWFFPLPRPRSGGADRLGDALEEARAAELAARREESYRPTASAELVGLYLAQVQTIRRMSVNRPAMARRSVYIVGEAEYLAPQEASTEAANAMLKVLEEPPRDTVFILTASDPDELLPTIRSRLLPVRVHPLKQDSVVAALTGTYGAAPEQARLAAALSEGSIGRALAFLPQNGEPGPLEIARQHARELLEATLAASAVGRLSAALATAPARARGSFADTLDFLALWIRDLAAVADGAPEFVVNVDKMDRLRELSSRLPARGKGAPAALRSVDLARGMTRSNINPQLTLAWLLRDVGQYLLRPI